MEKPPEKTSDLDYSLNNLDRGLDPDNPDRGLDPDLLGQDPDPDYLDLQQQQQQGFLRSRPSQPGRRSPPWKKIIAHFLSFMAKSIFKKGGSGSFKKTL